MITMNEMLSLALALTAGLLLGAFFFGGLWWTVRKGLSAKQPALLFLGSSLLRTGVVLIGFYLVSAQQWQRLLLCLLGFVAARFVVTWLTRLPQERPASPVQEARHAP